MIHDVIRASIKGEAVPLELIRDQSLTISDNLMALVSQGFALVTPASRGIGLASAQQLLTQTQLPVVATARRNCDEVRDRILSCKTLSSDAEKRLRMFEVDVKHESTISSMTDTIRKEYPETPLRLALTVPGILHVDKSPSQVDAASALESFQVNALGPLLLMKHLSQLLPTRSASAFEPTSASGSNRNNSLNLPSHAIYAMMAARVGSVSDNSSGGWYSYRASKASVFQLAKSFDLYLRSRSGQKALAVALHPGTVRTDFTKEFWKGRDMLEPLDSAERLLRFLVEMPPDIKSGRGRCWDWKGNEVYP
ncbi:hypothetical protein N7532_006000 [Penicillium argentinense]|uniref:Uncharacterized protein n=1 Tax=Penicillium argentinense TaxID=1131581 RepID=A0A9W9KAC9_9EURO|nr:uncharacterized protein N7532_006000 [Penicillium argentinense]KAJ5098999.1 hypothetical protein N7532_006000 [Penicillium argentinense]